MSDPTPDLSTSAAVTELQQLLLDSSNISNFLQQLAGLAVTTLPGQLSCGITMRRDHRPITVASSDMQASQLDEIQYGHHEGPCLTTLSSGEVIIIDDLATDDRWGG